MTPEEERIAFEKSIEERNRRKKEAEDRKSFVPKVITGPDLLPWVMFEKDRPLVIRIVGLPHEMRELPTDTRLVYHTKWLNDTGRDYVKINWPQKRNSEGRELGELKPNWFLLEFFESVFEGEWVKFEKPVNGKDGQYIHYNNKSPVYVHLHHNRIHTKQPVIPKANPMSNKRVLMNVINRTSDYCRLNRETQALTLYYKDGEWEDKKHEKHRQITYEVGISEFLYQQIYSKTVLKYKHWGIDLSITKRAVATAGEKDKTVFDIFDATSSELPHAIRSLVKKPQAFTRGIVIEGDERFEADIPVSEPLTAEEAEYRKVDFDQQYPDTTIREIYTNLKKLISDWDIEKKKTVWTDRLMYELAEEDKITGYVEGNPSSQQVDGLKETPAPATVDQPPPRPRQATTEGSSGAIDFLKIFPKLGELDPKEQEILKNRVAEVKGSRPIYKEKDKGDIFSCVCVSNWPGTENRVDFPTDISKCAVCARGLIV